MQGLWRVMLVRLWFLTVVVFATTAVVIACGGGGGGEAEESAQQVAEQALAVEVAEDARRAQRSGQKTVTEERPQRVAAEGEVIFPDPEVENAVRATLKQDEGPIMIADVTEFTEFQLNQRWYIADISGTEHMTNLVKFDMSQNTISDISPVAGLTKLTSLDMAQNAISDVTPVAGLTNLTYLRLKDNLVSDLTPLSGLTNLTELDLWENQITDISPLASLTNLETLNLTKNQISDISPLASLSSLNHLELTRNEVTDISPLLESGLGEGDTVRLWGLSLDDNSVNVVIPALEEKGVRVDK